MIMFENYMRIFNSIPNLVTFITTKGEECLIKVFVENEIGGIKLTAASAA